MLPYGTGRGRSWNMEGIRHIYCDMGAVNKNTAHASGVYDFMAFSHCISFIRIMIGHKQVPCCATEDRKTYGSTGEGNQNY